MTPDEIASGYDALVKRTVEWAGAQPDIQAVIQVGSRARTDHPADAWSDTDLLCVVDDVKQYENNTAFLDEIGRVMVSIPSHTAGNDVERLALFEGGYAIDFVWVPAAVMQQLQHMTEVPDIFKRGAKVLLDKTGQCVKVVPVLPTPLTPRPLPSAGEFDFTCNAFWYTTVYVAKQLRRGDLWLVKVRDGNLKGLMLQMIEWHARATLGNSDTWHMGRFMNDWADARVTPALQRAFGHYDAEDSWRAFFVTMDTFRWLAQETAEAMGCECPSRVDHEVTEYVTRLWLER
jgi:aminoglycoside 6-adenylyltransferase